MVMEIRRLRTYNRALLAKWLWRFGLEQDSLRRQVEVFRYGEKSIWDSRDVRGRHGCEIWKSILLGRESFCKCIKFVLGSGENINFWKDVWVGDDPLMVSFPNIFRLALDQQTSVAKCYDGIRGSWTPRLRRESNDWEFGELLKLLESLGNVNPNNERSDKWTWKLNQRGAIQL